jgi:hypothetical protein
MSKAKPYSPKIEPDLIPILYRERQARHIPMTVLASRLIRAALRYEGVLENDATPRVAEKPVRNRNSRMMKQ